MSRRSSRRSTTKKAQSLSPGVTAGLESLIEGNESTIASMLSVTLPSAKGDDDGSESHKKLLDALTDVMAMNNLSAEALLARFFHATIISEYCTSRLGVSGKGNEATLAARIATKWAKPGFEVLPLVVKDVGEVDKVEEDGKKQQSKMKAGDGCKKRGKAKKDTIPEGNKKQKTRKTSNDVP